MITLKMNQPSCKTPQFYQLWTDNIMVACIWGDRGEITYGRRLKNKYQVMISQRDLMCVGFLHFDKVKVRREK